MKRKAWLVVPKGNAPTPASQLHAKAKTAGPAARNGGSVVG